MIGTPLTSSMTKYGRPASVAPASSTRAMLAWSISARACRSASKRAMTCAVSMPGLMSLRATLRWTGCGLLGHPDRAHAAFADLLQQLVRADDRAGALGERLVDGGGHTGGDRGVQETAGPEVGRDQFLDLGTLLDIVATSLRDVGSSICGRVDFNRGAKDRYRRSAADSAWSSSGRITANRQCEFSWQNGSHNWRWVRRITSGILKGGIKPGPAKAQYRLAVAREMPRQAAASSSDRPAK